MLTNNETEPHIFFLYFKLWVTIVKSIKATLLLNDVFFYKSRYREQNFQQEMFFLKKLGYVLDFDQKEGEIGKR